MCTTIDKELTEKYKGRTYGWKLVYVCKGNIYGAFQSSYKYELDTVITAKGRRAKRKVGAGAFHLYVNKSDVITNVPFFQYWVCYMLVRVRIVEYIGAGKDVDGCDTILARKIRIPKTKAIRERLESATIVG